MNRQPETVGKGRRQIEKHSLLAHQLQLFIRYVVAVFDRIGACVDRDLNALPISGVYCDLPILLMRFFNYCLYGRERNIVINGDLNNVDVVESISLNRVTTFNRISSRQKILVHDRFRKSRVKALQVSALTLLGDFSSGSNDSRTDETSIVDVVAQSGVTVNT